jgi:hypothetical protein
MGRHEDDGKIRIPVQETPCQSKPIQVLSGVVVLDSLSGMRLLLAPRLLRPTSQQGRAPELSIKDAIDQREAGRALAHDLQGFGRARGEK